MNIFYRDWHRRNDCVLFVTKFDLGRGDVVILEDPKIKHSILIKRIIALPGEYISSSLYIKIFLVSQVIKLSPLVLTT